LEVILAQRELVIYTKKHNNINMKDADSMEKHVERKLLIAQLVQYFFAKHPGSKTVFVSASDIKHFSPLLTNPGAFLIAVERVIDELSPSLSIDTTEYGGWPGVSQGAFRDAVEHAIDDLRQSSGITAIEHENDLTCNIWIEIDDPKRLNKYIAEKEVELAEIRKETNRHTFILDEGANLYLVGSELPPYSIERGSLRHKLIYYLAKHGGYMSAAQLAKKVGSSPVKIRKTVAQLRDQIVDRFDAPGTDLIHSRDTGSYRAGTITLRVPKGYTP
jgi:biotin operon repressor